MTKYTTHARTVEHRAVMRMRELRGEKMAPVGEKTTGGRSFSTCRGCGYHVCSCPDWDAVNQAQARKDAAIAAAYAPRIAERFGAMVKSFVCGESVVNTASMLLRDFASNEAVTPKPTALESLRARYADNDRVVFGPCGNSGSKCVLVDGDHVDEVFDGRDVEAVVENIDAALAKHSQRPAVGDVCEWTAARKDMFAHAVARWTCVDAPWPHDLPQRLNKARLEYCDNEHAAWIPFDGKDLVHFPPGGCQWQRLPDATEHKPTAPFLDGMPSVNCNDAARRMDVVDGKYTRDVKRGELVRMDVAEYMALVERDREPSAVTAKSIPRPDDIPDRAVRTVWETAFDGRDVRCVWSWSDADGGTYCAELFRDGSDSVQEIRSHRSVNGAVTLLKDTRAKP